MAKKPSFQIWGGSLFSNGKISLNPATKNNLAGEPDPYSYKTTGGSAITFSSWVELGLTANGEVKGLASGAGTGYSNTSDAQNIIGNNYSSISKGFGVGSPGGNTGNYCSMSTLSIPNKDCNNNIVGTLSSNSIQSNTSSDKSALVARFSDESSDDYKLITMDKGGTIGGESGETISSGQTKVIKAKDQTITITENISYEDTTYTNLTSIPKLIIYAENIKIKCNVTRIDAVLIADGDIDTCVDDDGNTPDLNDKARSTQLIINGSTISDTLTLGRTYGAATGKNSIIPAEIINYDSSLILWSNKQSRTTTTGKLTEASRRELAPRY